MILNIYNEAHEQLLSSPRHPRRQGQHRIPFAPETRRRFEPNLQRKRYFVPSLGRRVTLTLTPRGMKTIDRHGIDAVAARLIANGEIRL